MKIAKSKLEALFAVVKGTEGETNLVESRKRDSFLKEILEPTKTFIDDRKKIYDTFCIKKEDGTPDLLDGDKYQFPNDKLEELNKELKALLEEEIEIVFPEGLKEIIEKSVYKPKIGEMEIIDGIIKLI